VSALPAPLGLLAELTHRCPLQCLYCSNPLQLQAAEAELSTEAWVRVFEEAAALGVMQLHLSGGEPTLRRDLAVLIAAARKTGLYTNLITAGLPNLAGRLPDLAEAGLDHVQLSVQGSDDPMAEAVSRLPRAMARKAAAAEAVVAAGLPLTLNAVVHRMNLDQIPELIALASEWGAQRLEVAHVQYYGWALRNRGRLMPTLAQLERATAAVEAARAVLKGRLAIDYVVPDYYAQQPKACMAGWGRRFIAVTPDGRAMPCHAADSLPDMDFARVTEHPLAWIWRESEAFQRFRGTGWMPEPCRSCERQEVDWGGCRCQAFALTGDAAATDPACGLSPHHPLMADLREEVSETLHYRR